MLSFLTAAAHFWPLGCISGGDQRDSGVWREVFAGGGGEERKPGLDALKMGINPLDLFSQGSLDCKINKAGPISSNGHVQHLMTWALLGL